MLNTAQRKWERLQTVCQEFGLLNETTEILSSTEQTLIMRKFQPKKLTAMAREYLSVTFILVSSAL